MRRRGKNKENEVDEKIYREKHPCRKLWITKTFAMYALRERQYNNAVIAALSASQKFNHFFKKEENMITINMTKSNCQNVDIIYKITGMTNSIAFAGMRKKHLLFCGCAWEKTGKKTYSFAYAKDNVLKYRTCNIAKILRLSDAQCRKIATVARTSK
jgi:hypothetical protein